MKNIFLIVMTLVILSVTENYAQGSRMRFGLELNGGGSLSVRRIDNADVRPGGGFEALLHYKFNSPLGVYGGWGWNKLVPYSASGLSYEETGYVLGLNFMFADKDPSFSYYLRAGGLFNHIETEDAEGRIINDTGHGLGFQLACGVDMTLGNNWSFTPGIKFNSLSSEVNDEGVSQPMIYQYLSARIGFTRRF